MVLFLLVFPEIIPLWNEYWISCHERQQGPIRQLTWTLFPCSGWGWGRGTWDEEWQFCIFSNCLHLWMPEKCQYTEKGLIITSLSVRWTNEPNSISSEYSSGVVRKKLDTKPNQNHTKRSEWDQQGRDQLSQGKQIRPLWKLFFTAKRHPPPKKKISQEEHSGARDLIDKELTKLNRKQQQQQQSILQENAGEHRYFVKEFTWMTSAWKDVQHP